MRLIKWLDKHFEETLMIILLIIISCVTMIQVIVRKVPWLTSLTWAEEFCRFMWIWSVFISLPYTIRMENMLRVGVLVDLLPQKVKKSIGIFVDFVNMFCMGLLGYYSIKVVKGIYDSHEFSPAMEWPMWIVYIVMLFGYLLATVRAFQVMIIHIKHFNEKDLTTLEQTMQDAAKEAEMAKGGDE
jgi:C4-dicarboxylate transporter DctQ subunit